MLLLDGRERRHCVAAAAAAALAAILYLNTLPAQFTFDDSFAVVRPPRSPATASHQRCLPAVRGC